MSSLIIKKTTITFMFVIIFTLLILGRSSGLVEGQEADAGSDQARSAAEEGIEEVEKELQRRQMELFKLKLR